MSIKKFDRRKNYVVTDGLKDRLREIMFNNRQTGAEFCRQVGISQSYLSDIFHDRAGGVSVRVLRDICARTGCEWAWLIGENETGAATPLTDELPQAGGGNMSSLAEGPPELTQAFRWLAEVFVKDRDAFFDAALDIRAAHQNLQKKNLVRSSS